MISAVLSLVLGLVSWLGAPVIIPVIGLALGTNALIKEKRLSPRKPMQMYLGLAGVVISSLATGLFLLRRYR